MRPLVRRLTRRFAAADQRLIRSGRRSAGAWVAGDVQVLLLTTTGRRSGRPHTTPLVFHRFHRDAGGGLLLIAANGAADWNPDWFRNLVADPHASVEIDGVRHAVVATVLDEAERTRSWPEACRAFPGLGPAQARSRRTIPLVRLSLHTTRRG
jgi:deazaflavin-dependent oxidoreductase (nitroreductase family)